MLEGVHYRVSMPRPHTHLFEVEATFPAGPEQLDAVLPVWTPGSYLVREFARQVQDVSAVDAEGAALAVRRVDKRTWRVEAGGQAVRLRYRVYANELTVRTSHLDGSHGYFNGATLFLYTEATRGLAHHVTVEAPAGWKAFCALERQGEVFTARDYDELVDSPFEVGPHDAATPSPPRACRTSWWSGGTRCRSLGGCARTCSASARRRGGCSGGCRRDATCSCSTSRTRAAEAWSTATPRRCYSSARRSTPRGAGRILLTLAAHEYFHLWNIKRVRPRALVPFDYSQENYTALLWAFEGATSYYDNLFVLRAGLMGANRYLTRLGETLSTLHGTPGRKTQSLAEASLVAWVKHYRPDENTSNSAISYYLKGEVVAMLLDLELRRATQDTRSLDDVMRLLWSRYGDGCGVPEDGVEAAASEVAGRDLSAFFDRAVRGTEELDYSLFAHVGLEMRLRPRDSTSDKGGTAPHRGKGEGRPKGWLGITPKGNSTLASVADGSPAQEAGLYVDDELVALDGWRVDTAGLLARCEDRAPGEQVRITVFRRDRLVEVPVVLGQKPADAVWLARVEKATDAQKAAFQAWLGAPWDEVG